MSEVFTNQQIADAILTTPTLKEAAKKLGAPATHFTLSHWKQKHKLSDFTVTYRTPVENHAVFASNNHYACTVQGIFTCVLVISDTHFPYQHPDTLRFLHAIKDRYFPLYPKEQTIVVHIGDEGDWHSLSYHEHDPDLLNNGAEIKALRKGMAALQDMFPEMHLLESNHGSLYFRKALSGGISKELLMSYNQLLGVTSAWKWYPTMTLCTGEGKLVNFHHGRGANVMLSSQKLGMSLVQGHHHSKFCINYWGNPLSLNYGMNVGCLIDDNSPAFQYNRLTVERPVIGCGIILDGKPRLLPMELGLDGRWIGKL